jgi:elongation factor G
VGRREPRRELREARGAGRAGARRRTAGAEAWIEAVADFDDALTAKYLDGEPISADQLRKALREATLRFEVVPVLCGAAFQEQGRAAAARRDRALLPSPLDVPPVEGTNPKTGETVQRMADDNEPSPRWCSSS